MEPLLRLLIANVRDASNLDLIYAPASALDGVESELLAVWDGPGDLVDKWFDSNSRLFTAFDRAHRPLQAYRGKQLPITRVLPVRDLHYLFRDLPVDLASEPDVRLALSSIQSVSATTSDRATIETAFDRLRVRVCPPSSQTPGAALYVRQLAARGTPCWVGRRPRSTLGTSQQWRDRLGLEHYPFRQGRTRPALQGDALVRITFIARLSPSELPLDDPQSLVRSEPEGMWLVRPVAIHGGNARFVQRQVRDIAGTPRKHGRTINIETTTYPEAEREVILMYGERATVHWHAMELFSGLPDRRPHDDDHSGFVSTLTFRLGWT